ncbi:hypothetical protein K0M31_015428 [Melipona bicolor]|uniref:Uncharacterized protein n=1 Tax=Melipona bicolor TaxID=60889 RepID=A0AA40KFA1_9HYME|nr:hypothetical protein K0M31_015428 [Melipona bicolor]
MISIFSWSKLKATINPLQPEFRSFVGDECYQLIVAIYSRNGESTLTSSRDVNVYRKFGSCSRDSVDARVCLIHKYQMKHSELSHLNVPLEVPLLLFKGYESACEVLDPISSQNCPNRPPTSTDAGQKTLVGVDW